MRIELNDAIGTTSERVQLAKVGEYKHEVYGEFSITLEDLEAMKTNFDSNVRKQELEGKPVLPFDYSHDSGAKSAGWIVALDVDVDAKGVDSIFAKVNWTPKAAEAIRDNEFKFVSPDIVKNYTDKETGQKYRIVLLGAALTNVPFLRDMEAVLLLAEASKKLKLSAHKEKMLTVEELLKAVLELPEEEKKKFFMGIKEHQMPDEMEEHKEEVQQMSESLKLEEGKNKELATKVAVLSSSVTLMKKENAFTMLLTEGKAVEAQRKSFISGDMLAFAKAAVNIKLDEAGTSATGTDTDGDLESEVERLVLKLQEVDKSLGYGQAMSLVLSENKELSEKIEKLHN